MAYNKRAGHAVRAAGTPHSRRNKSQRDSSPLHWDWSTVMDRGQDMLTAAGMVPGLGNVADIANVAISSGRGAYAKYTGDDAAAKKHAAAAAINMAAAIPGAGLAVGAGKLAKSGLAIAKGAKTADKMADASKMVKKGIEAKTKAKAATETAEAATKSKGYFKGGIEDAKKVFKGEGKGFKEYYAKNADASLGEAVLKAGAKKGVKKVEKEVAKDYAKSEIKKSDKKAKEKNLATKDKAKKQNIA